MPRISRFLPLLILLWVIPLLAPAQEDHSSWTHFRDSGLNGISTETGFPITWNDSIHISWKLPIEGKGWSSPVVLNEQVWVTTADEEKKEMRAICVDLKNGELIHNRVIFTPETFYRIHAINSYATPIIIQVKGRKLMISNGSTVCIA
ncbi:MAG: hypothetical protein KAR16_09050 [Bacteroidales bacterium]|nr:hypothetical protein [Bacteroidales bacterium]